MEDFKIANKAMRYSCFFGLKRSNTLCKKTYNMILMFVMIALMSNVCINTICMALLSEHYGTLQMLECYTVIFPVFRCILKVYSRYGCNGRVWILYDKLIAKYDADCNDPDKDANFTRAEKKGTFILNFYVRLYASLMSIYAALPLLIFVIKKCLGKRAALKTPFPFLSQGQLPDFFYFLGYVCQLGAIFCISSGAVYEGLFGSIGNYVIACFENVCVDIEKIIASINDTITDETMEISKLKKVIRAHSEAIILAKEFKREFAFQFEVDSFFGIAAVCFSLIQATLNKSVTPRVSYAIHVSYAYIGLFFYSNVGQKLSDSSMRVRQKASELPWYEVSPRFGKMVTMILRRTTKPIQFTGPYYYIGDYENFAVLVKMSFSFLTLIQSLTEDSMEE